MSADRGVTVHCAAHVLTVIGRALVAVTGVGMSSVGRAEAAAPHRAAPAPSAQLPAPSAQRPRGVCDRLFRHAVAKEDRARVFRWPRHVRHPAVAEGAVSGCATGRVRGGAGPGIRAQRHRAQGEEERRRRSRRPGSAPRVRGRILLPDAAGACHLRIGLPARHEHRAAADRQGAGGRGARDGRRRGGARRHGEGQRPGAVRADVHGARPVADDHLAVEGSPFPGRRPERSRDSRGLCRQAQDSHHPDEGEALLAGSQPVAHLARGRRDRGSLRGTPRARLHDQPSRQRGAGQAGVRGDRVQERQPGGRERHALRPRGARAHRCAQQDRAASTASGRSRSSRTAWSA